MEKKKSGFSHDSAQTAYETGRAYYDAQEYDRARREENRPRYD